MIALYLVTANTKQCLKKTSKLPISGYLAAVLHCGYNYRQEFQSIIILILLYNDHNTNSPVLY